MQSNRILKNPVLDPLLRKTEGILSTFIKRQTESTQRLLLSRSLGIIVFFAMTCGNSAFQERYPLLLQEKNTLLIQQRVLANLMGWKDSQGPMAIGGQLNFMPLNVDPEGLFPGVYKTREDYLAAKSELEAQSIYYRALAEYETAKAQLRLATGEKP